MNTSFCTRAILSTRIAPVALAFICIAAPAYSQIATGEFSAAFIGVGNFDTQVGLDPLKSYLYAANLGGAANVTVNGVTFVGNPSVNPTVAGQYSTTGLGTLFGSGGPNPGGQLGLLMQDFVYGAGVTAEALTFNGLTIGESYVVSFFNSSWEAASTGRRQTMSASGASTFGSGGFTFDEDMGATAQGQFNVLRYTFNATTASQVINFVAQVSGTTMHQYGFAVERVFNNTYSSGADWTTAAWGAAGVPNARGRSAAFAAAGAPTSINLDADVTAGHLQFDGTNAWTVSSATNRTLTLQADVGGVSSLVAKAGSHVVTPNITLSNNLLKTGAGQVTLNGNITAAAGAVIHASGGTLRLNGTSNHTGETIINSGAVLEVSTVSDYGVASGIGARTLAQENATVTGVALHFERGTLRFVGSTPQSTNRHIRVLTDQSATAGVPVVTGATIDASGTVPSATLSFTNTGPNLNLFDTGGVRTIQLTGTNTGANTFAIPITNQATNVTHFNKAGAGTWRLTNDTNSFTGLTQVSGGVLNVSSLSNYGVASAIGARTLAQETATGNGIGLWFGPGTATGTLQYTGSTPQSTDRQIRVGTGGATFDASGSNPAATLSFTRTLANTNLFDTGGARAITLTGSNIGANVFGIPLTDQVAVTGATSLNKRGTGTWNLINTGSTYGGVTALEGGVLNAATLANYGVASSLGARASSQDVAGNIGIVFRGGTLQYTGAIAQSTDRAIRVSTVGGATIDASGSVPAATLSFTAATSPDFFENGGNRQLTLTGSNTGTNVFGMAIPETGGQTTVTKNGAGKWALSGASTYTGPTNVNNGTLLVNGSLGITAVSVASGATLGGTGTIAGSIALGAGGHLAPGTSVGTLTTGSLSLAIGSFLDYEFNPAPDLVNITTAGGLAINGGGLNLFSEGTTTPFTANGTYTLFDYNTNYTGLLSNLSILNSQAGKFYTLIDNVGATTIDLTITDAAQSEWNGVAGDNLWSSAGNWTAGTPNAQGIVAKFGAIPTAATSVAVSGPKTVGAILFDNANSYTVTGGAGDTITLDNGFAAAAIGVAVGSHTITAPLALAGNLSASAAAGSVLTLSGDISGGTRDVAFGGPGGLVISGTNTYGATNITGGTVTLGNGGTTGTLGSGPANIGAGATLALNRSNDFTLGNNITGAGTLSKLGANTVTLGGTNTFSTLGLTAGGVKVGGASALPSGVALNIGGGTLDLNEFNATASSLTGAGGNITDNAATVGTTTIALNLTGSNAFVGNIMNGATRSIAVQINSGTLAHSGSLNVATIGLGAAGTLSLERTNDYTVAANITGAGTLVKNGAGVLTLTGANNFGALTANAGTVNVGASGALNTSATAAFNGAMLDMNDFNGIVGGLAGTGATITSNGGTPGTSVLTVNQSVNTTFDGTITDGPERLLGLTKVGNGILTLAGTTTNSYYGGTIVSGGTLRLQKTGVNAVVSDITIGDAVGSDVLELGAADQIGDASVVTLTAGGAGNSAFFRLNGFNETVKGLTSTVGNAAVLENNSATVGNIATLTVDTAGSNFAYDGIVRNTSVAASIFALTKTGAGTFTLRNTAAVGVDSYTGATTITDGKLVLDNLSGFGATPISINSTAAGALTINTTTRDLTTAAPLSGAGEFVKNGDFTLTLTGVGSQTGKTIINAGTLGLGNNGVLGSGEIVMNGGIIRASGAARVLSNPVTVNGSFTLGRLTDLVGSITLNADATITASNPDGVANNNSILGPVGGNFRLTLAEGAGGAVAPFGIGTGALVVNAVNTNTGGTTVASGRVNVSATGALSTGPLTVNSGFLNLSNAAQSTTSLDGAGGTVTLGAGHTLTVSQSTNTTFSGVIAGTGNLVKELTGTLVLAGTDTFTGTTTVNGGTLAVSGSISGSAVTLNGGTLGGIGTTGTVASIGGALAPGASAGTLTVAALTLDSASALNFELATAGIIGSGVNDLLSIGGSLTLDGTLNVTPLAGFDFGTYRIVNYGGAFTDNGLDLSPAFISAYPGSSIDVATVGQVNLVVVPEPGSAMLLLAGLGATMVRRRRR